MASRESPYKNLKFLIIDDFPAMCKQIERILSSAGAESIDIVYNGEKALLACSKQKYDVIFADFNLGAGKNGQQLLEELRHRKLLKSTCAYIMITAEATKDFVFGALEFSPDAYLNKPFNQAELLQRLQRIVAEKQSIAPVLMAEESGNIELAIELCISGIQTDAKRRTSYMKMLGDFYMRSGKCLKAKGCLIKCCPCVSWTGPSWARRGATLSWKSTIKQTLFWRRCWRKTHLTWKPTI